MTEFAYASTESKLREWRQGSTVAERLGAAILQLDGFTDVDPQAPLGGSDDRKDILCAKETVKYVSAVYFPPTDQHFSDIKKKFEHDLEGAIRHGRQGFVFITNQHMSLSQRSTLEDIGSEHGKTTALYHRERIRVLLDSPVGYGIRFEFLRIPMNENEQFAYFTSSSGKIEEILLHQANEFRLLSRRVEQLHFAQMYATETIQAIATGLEKQEVHSSKEEPVLKYDWTRFDGANSPVSSFITPNFLLFVHRTVCTELPLRFVGKFRDVVVWIGGPGSTKADAKFVPPSPDELPEQLGLLLSKWNQEFSQLWAASTPDKVESIARFHHKFAMLHPFVDGNGRVARTILVQQCNDLIGYVDPTLLDKGEQYYLALSKADRGDYEALVELIRQAMEM